MRNNSFEKDFLITRIQIFAQGNIYKTISFLSGRQNTNYSET